MKFAIVVVLFAVVIGVYSEPQVGIAVKAKAGIGGGAGNPKSLSPADQAEIEAILRKIVGPKISVAVTKLIASLVNGALSGIPIGGLLHGVTGLLQKLLKSRGIVENLLAGDDPNAFNANPKGSNGKPKNLSPADQARLFKILMRTVGPYTANYIVRIATIAVNGIIGKIPIRQLLHGVTGVVGKVANPKGIVGKLIGQKGLGQPISRLLGAPGKIINI